MYNSVNFVQFYDLTKLYPKYESQHYISSSDVDAYVKKVKLFLNENKKTYNNGDLLFLGSTYESRQYYGFARVKKNNDDIDLEYNFEYIEEAMNCPDVYYGEAIEQLELFYIKNSSKLFYNDLSFKEVHCIIINELKEKGQYYPPSN